MGGVEGFFKFITFRYIKEEFLLSEYSTRTVLTISKFSKKVIIILVSLRIL